MTHSIVDATKNIRSLSVSLSCLILSVVMVFTALPLRAETNNDWQQLQAQATSAYQAGNYQQAEHAARKAIARAEKADNGAMYKASSLNILAFIQSASGDMPAALQSIDEAVQLGKKAAGQPDENVAGLLFNQGLLLQQADQPEQALPVLQQSIDDYLALNSVGNGKLWQAVQAQALILQTSAPEQALIQIEQALSGFADKSGFSHKPDLAHRADLAILGGQIAFEQQQYQQAIAILQPVQQALNQTDNKNRQIEILELLASSYDADQSEHATPFHEQALALRAQQPASMATVMHLNELAMRHQQKQEYAQAEQLYQQAIATLQQLNQSEGIEQALILGNLASVKLAEKDNKAALALFEQSYALHHKLEQRPLDAAQIAGYVGSIYYNQREYSKAEPAFLQALSWLEKSPQDALESELVALQNLNALYTSWGKESKARSYENRIRELKKSIKNKNS